MNENNIHGTQLFVEVPISNQQQLRYKVGNAQLSWIIFLETQIKQYTWNRD